ncbi:unnamed protein product, partial [Rotaria sordida]
FIYNNFGQTADPRHRTDITPSLHLLSSSEHDDTVGDLSSIVSRPFDMSDLQSNVTSINDNMNELTENKNENIEDTTMDSSSDENSNEHVFDENSDEDSVNEEASDDSDEEELFNSYEHHTDRNFTSTEIALALSLLKSRHSLINSCISNICKLLKLLRVPNSPLDFRHVRSLIYSPYKSTIFGDTLISCPSCHKISTDYTHCSTTPNCVNTEKFVSNPTINHVLRIEPQIRSILERNNLITPNKDENTIRDIIDAPFYRKIVNNESSSIITLLMNSDGAVVKSISRSVWVTTFVINELSPFIRFNRENVIIAMISVGSVKPNKSEMQIFLKHLVKELIQLERIGLQYTPISSSNCVDQTISVFVIVATCDRPAASLIINHTEVGGYYGCIHCENIKIRKANARVFLQNENEDFELRSNDTYDEPVALLQRSSSEEKRDSITSINNGLDGLRGPCELRTLKYFDVYQSFLSDTLHTLYEGVMARMLRIFFDKVSQKTGITREMSIRNAIDAVSAVVKSISYPSTTAFDQVLDEQRYDHFRCLAFAAHLIESSKIDLATHQDVRSLLEEFNRKFESLYTKQQAKPAIHTLNHFADSIRNYGPAFRYSTFEFEATIGTLTRLIHNGNSPTIELLRNLDLLQQTWLATSYSSLPSELKIFDYQINASSLAPDVKKFVTKYTGGQSYNLYKTVFVEQQRFTSDRIDIFRRTLDGCLMYNRKNIPAIGFLETIISFDNGNEPVLVIRPVSLPATADTMSINHRIYKCTNVLYGTYHGTTLEVTNLDCIIQKLAFRRGTNVKFPPIPNSMFFFSVSQSKWKYLASINS